MWDEAGLESLRTQNSDTLDTWLVLRRDNANLAPQLVALQLVGQVGIDGNVDISLPGVSMRIRGTFTLNIRSGDTFKWGGYGWKITEPAFATETNTSVARRAIAEKIGKDA